MTMALASICGFVCMDAYIYFVCFTSLVVENPVLLALFVYASNDFLHNL